MDRTSSSRPVPWLINRNFALLWSGQLISAFGDMLYVITLSLWIAVTIANHQPWAPAAVSGVMVVTALSTLLFGPFAGVLVDRWDKRWTMARMDMIRAALLLLLIPLSGLIPLPFVHTTPPVAWQLGAIYTVVLAATLCRQLFSPARFTILSEILPEAHRLRASALEQSSSSLITLIGPLVAAPLFFLFGMQWVLLADALSFVVSFLAILAVRVPALPSQSDPVETPEAGRSPGTLEKHEGQRKQNAFLCEWLEGLRFYQTSQLMRTLLITFLLVTLGSGMLEPLLFFFFQRNLHAPLNLYGVLVTAIGAGSLLGAVVADKVAGRLGELRTYWLCLVLLGALVLLFAQQKSVWPAIVLLGLAGLPQGLLFTVVSPLYMQIIPHPIMGRVMSVFNTALMGCNLLSFTLAGVLGTLLEGLHGSFLGLTFGPYDTIYMGTGLCILLAAWYAMSHLRGIQLAGEQQAHETQAEQEPERL